MFSITNHWLCVSVAAKGAELQSIYHRTHRLEYLWQGDPAWWAKRSPLLFPIVGALKQNRFFYNGKSYAMGRHGFARDREFTPLYQSDQRLSFRLLSDSETIIMYPFKFELIVNYELKEDELHVGYIVKNMSELIMYFSIGAHPAFRVPLSAGNAYSVYYLYFSEPETLPRWPISPDGLILSNPEPFLADSRQIPLSRELFYRDALVFKSPRSASVSLRSAKDVHGLNFHLTGFPYLGIWAAKDADFVCIEPWCGIADSVDGDQQIAHKEGIIPLRPGGEFTIGWQADFY